MATGCHKLAIRHVCKLPFPHWASTRASPALVSIAWQSMHTTQPCRAGRGMGETERRYSRARGGWGEDRHEACRGKEAGLLELRSMGSRAFVMGFLPLHGGSCSMLALDWCKNEWPNLTQEKETNPLPGCTGSCGSHFRHHGNHHSWELLIGLPVIY